MFQFLTSIFGSAYFEIAILIVLLTAFITHRKDPRLVVSGIRIVRTIIVVLIFFYFMFIWASAVQPTLRAISVFGMFLINFFMFYNLMLARLERPYRDALALISREPEKPELMQDIWSAGKRFYYLRYAWSSLFSGVNPFRFLGNLATDRVRADLKNTLHSYGVAKGLVSLQAMADFMRTRLDADANLPGEFKDLMAKAIDSFVKHPWIEEQTNEFLQLVTERPEELNFPQWMEKFETSIRESHK
jgi:Ca2+/Na+ antiporter